MLYLKDIRIVLAFLLLFLVTTLHAKTKTYQIEILIFETKDEAALSQSWPLKPGKPSILNTVHIDSNTDANVTPLSDNELKLGVPKQKIENNYHLILHKGWRQTVTDKDKDNALPIHITGGIQYKEPAPSAQDQSENQTIHPQDLFEVEGIIKLINSRQLSVETDLVFRKPMSLISKNAQTGKFAQVSDLDNWKKLPNTKLQAFRLTDSSAIILSDMHYIDHPLYGVIILVTPEKT